MLWRGMKMVKFPRESRRAPAETIPRCRPGVWLFPVLFGVCFFHSSSLVSVCSDNERRGHTHRQPTETATDRREDAGDRATVLSQHTPGVRRIPLPHPDCAWFTFNGPAWIYQWRLNRHVVRCASGTDLSSLRGCYRNDRAPTGGISNDWIVSRWHWGRRSGHACRGEKNVNYFICS